MKMGDYGLQEVILIMENRKKNRLDSFHYNSWYFFVTINVEKHQKVFGDVVDEKMVLNKYGKIVEKYWININAVYSNVSLGIFVIMPNHLHWILIIDDFDVGEDIIFPKSYRIRAINNRYNKLANIIKWFKQITNKEIKKSWLQSFKRQKSFYDHIIRNEKDFDRIVEYIKLNPYKRENDKYYMW